MGTAPGQMPPTLIQKKSAFDQEKRKLLAQAESLTAPTARVSTAKEAQRIADEIDAIEICVNIGYPSETVCKYCGMRMLVGSKTKNEHLVRFNMIWEEEHVKTACHEGYVTLKEKYEELKEALPKMIKEFESKSTLGETND